MRQYRIKENQAGQEFIPDPFHPTTHKSRNVQDPSTVRLLEAEDLKIHSGWHKMSACLPSFLYSRVYMFPKKKKKRVRVSIFDIIDGSRWTIPIIHCMRIK